MPEPPPPISVAESPAHIAGLLTVATGEVITVTTLLALALQPLISVAVTVYVPDMVEIILSVVAAVLQT